MDFARGKGDPAVTGRKPIHQSRARKAAAPNITQVNWLWENNEIARFGNLIKIDNRLAVAVTLFCRLWLPLLDFPWLGTARFCPEILGELFAFCNPINKVLGI